MFQIIAQAKNCPPGETGANCFLNLPNTTADGTSLQTIFNILFGVIGAIAVLIIIVQGIRFILSQGDSQKAADARKGVIYAVVGLAIAVLSEVIVTFVIGRL